MIFGTKAVVSTSEEGAGEAVNAIGAAIRRARGTISVQQLARMTHMSAAHISMLESGKRPDPQFSSILKIARALHVSLDELTAELSVDVSTIESHITQAPTSISFLNDKIDFTQRYLETLKDLVLAMADALEATKAPAVNQVLEALAEIARAPVPPVTHVGTDPDVGRLRQLK